MQASIFNFYSTPCKIPWHLNTFLEVSVILISIVSLDVRLL
jgi:hypothetical protein